VTDPRHALEIENLTYRYAGADEATLNDVSLTIDRGEFVVLAGRSGSGKTSLLRAPRRRDKRQGLRRRARHP